MTGGAAYGPDRSPLGVRADLGSDRTSAPVAPAVDQVGYDR